NQRQLLADADGRNEQVADHAGALGRPNGRHSNRPAARHRRSLPTDRRTQTPAAPSSVNRSITKRADTATAPSTPHPAPSPRAPENTDRGETRAPAGPCPPGP